MRIGGNFKGQPPVFCFVLERPANHFQQAREKYFFRFDRNRPGLDLRQVQNVADQVQQICAGAVNGACELHLFGRQIAVGVVAQLLAQNQNTVQRGAQLVRHVGQEFRFVLGSKRELLGFFFQCAARLLDFLIFALDFDVLFGELLRFLRQLARWSRCNSFCLRLQLGG